MQAPIQSLRKTEWFAIFVLVFVSRLLTSTYYIEEPDSMRFALAVREFDIIKLQPHFPGYPVFCWLSQVLFSLTGSIAVSFSIIGAMSICTIIYSVVSLFTLLLKVFSKISLYALVALLFFNPLLWILSTSYMPDCMGVAIVCLIFMFVSKGIVQQNISYILLAQFFAGILFGTRLSYVPYIIIPSVFALIYFPKKGIQILIGLSGVLLWLIPLILITGFPELLHAAQTHTDGHFNDWGGSYVTENNFSMRFVMLIRGIWADGFGLYWSNRNILTFLSSVLVLLIILISFGIQGNKINYNKRILFLLISSTFAYIAWIVVGQNIIYKARHVLPILPVLILFLALIINKLLNWRNKLSLSILVPLILLYSYTGSFLAYQHTKSSAIAQAKDYVLTHANDNKNVIVSIGLVNDYLRVHGVKAKLVEIKSPDEIALIKSRFMANLIWYVGIDANRYLPNKEINRFYHNPYVNRMWPVIEVVKLK